MLNCGGLAASDASAELRDSLRTIPERPVLKIPNVSRQQIHCSAHSGEGPSAPRAVGWEGRK